MRESIPSNSQDGTFPPKPSPGGDPPHVMRTKRRRRQNLPVHSLTSHSHTELTAQKKKKNSFFSHSHRPSSSSGTYPLPASRTLVDTGAKTMLRVSSRKTLQLEKITYYTQATTDIDSVYSGESKFKLADVQLLEREIKQRKQKFGVEVYDCMLLLEVDNDMPMEEKELKIRVAFDRARKDIAVTQAKIECKKEEIAALEAEMAAAAQGAGRQSYDIPPPSGNVVMSDHPEEMEYGFGGLPTRRS
eukprot:scaffold3045_cov271-Chaetoceros_neogracile.AAC.11